MLNNSKQYSFSQNIIAELYNTSRATITRVLKDRNLKTIINDANKKSKKYDIASIQTLHSYFFTKKQIVKSKIHAFYNLKGGTGKTSICSQLSSHLALIGFKVLVVDCDPQAHMTVMFDYPEDSSDNLTLYDVIVNNVDINTAIKPVYPNLDIILSNLSLSRLEVPLSQKARREEKLRDSLSLVKKEYDYIFLDTNPSFSNLNLNVLCAADEINFITETAPFSLYGLRVMLVECKSFFSEMKKDFKYRILPNKYESKTATAQEVLGYIRGKYKENVANTVIRKSEDINKASLLKKPIAAFCNKKSSAFEDIMDLKNDFLEKTTE